jgi:hypothetical protein
MRATLLGGIAVLLLLGGAQAEPWNDCRERIEHATARLDRIAGRYGQHSRVARDARAVLERNRAWCRSHRHGWWDAHEHRWHTVHW